MKRRWKLGIAIVLLCCFAVAMAGCFGQFFTYDRNDVAVINKIIEENELSIRKNKPSEWNFVLWTEDKPKKIKGLLAPDIADGNSEFGVVDLSGLSGLEQVNWFTGKTKALILPETVMYVNCSSNGLEVLDCSLAKNLKELVCSENELAELDVTGLYYLEVLDCTDNQLQVLDLTDNVQLLSLACGNNQLTELNVTALKQLTQLYCYQNEIMDLSVRDLPALEELYCYENPLERLELRNLPNLYTLHCSEERGRVRLGDGLMLVDFDYPARVITLKAEPPAGYFLGGITNLPEGVEIVDNTVQFQLPYSYYELTPRFWENILKK